MFSRTLSETQKTNKTQVTLHRRVSSAPSEAWPIKGWTELNDRLKVMYKSKMLEKVLVRSNPNKTGGHDPDVARHLLKPGRLPNQDPCCPGQYI